MLMVLIYQKKHVGISGTKYQLVIYLWRKNPDACVGDESRINKVKRIFFFTAPKKEGFFFV